MGATPLNREAVTHIVYLVRQFIVFDIAVMIEPPANICSKCNISQGWEHTQLPDTAQQGWPCHDCKKGEHSRTWLPIFLNSIIEKHSSFKHTHIRGKLMGNVIRPSMASPATSAKSWAWIVVKMTEALQKTASRAVKSMLVLEPVHPWMSSRTAIYAIALTYSLL